MAERCSPVVDMTIEEALEIMEAMMDLLKQKLPVRCGLRVPEIVLGGSLGTRTELPERYDADIIIYSPDITIKEVIRNGYGLWLNQINQFMHSEKDLAKGFEFHALTDKGLQFTFEGIEIEIMVSPNWRKPADFYTFLETLRPVHRKLFTQCAAKWQIQFLKNQATRRGNFCREFIRRAKAWRALKWRQCTGGRGRPSSYLLSLLVIHAYENAHKTLGVFSTLSPETLAQHATEEVKSIVYNCDKVNIYWEQCYAMKQYPTLVPLRAPRIIDPANPTHNLYLTGLANFEPYKRCGEYDTGTGDWSSLIRNIGTLDLSKPVE
ncbi:2'-5'-oligoadenylate synthase 1-like isoform X1 [Halichondria panicea]|uniref:2'-5'-oligoadenylate synthase 1-like isoform X1 n=1 Tax=Halichondria panicea TaxID=6063 RepID=UPI00312B3C2B